VAPERNESAAPESPERSFDDRCRGAALTRGFVGDRRAAVATKHFLSIRLPGNGAKARSEMMMAAARKNNPPQMCVDPALSCVSVRH